MWVSIVLAVLIVAIIAWAAASGVLKFPTGTTSGGKVVFEEYSDFQCPFCATFFQDSYAQLKAEYIDTGKIEFSYKHFPLSSIHPNAEKAAEAYECAKDQGKASPYHDALFDKQSEWANLSDSTGKFESYAQQLGLDVSTFTQCLTSGSKAAKVQQDVQEGSAKGVTGTPTFFINGTKLVGAQPYSVIKQAIDSAAGTSSNSGTNSVTPNNDPPISLIVLNDSTCEFCQQTVQQIPSSLKSKFLPSLQVKIVEASSAEGKRLLDSLQVKALPAFVLEEKVAQAQNFSQLQGFFEKQGNNYVMSPEAAGGGLRWLEPPNVDGEPFLGDANAKVVVIEFSDFQCPFCEKFYSESEKQLLAKYGNKIRFVYKDLPLTNIHPNAMPAALADQCAFEQGKFWEFHNLLFDKQSEWASDSNATELFKQYARDLKLEGAKFNSCLDSEKFKSGIEADMSEASEFGVSGTPAFFINGINVPGAYPMDTYTKIIDAELWKSSYFNS